MRKLAFFSLIFLIFLVTGCSTGGLTQPNAIYYIEGDEIDATKRSSKRRNRGSIRTKYTSPAVHRATMRDYRVNGRVYRPTYVSVGDSMRGVASWYGPGFHGRRTSNGELYNMHDMTVAHKTWPMDTMVRVTNLDNGKSVVARINDRGPFVAGRVVDCSYAVAKKIGIDRRGTCNVKLDVVGFAGKVYNPKSKKPKPKVRLSGIAVQVGAFSKIDNAKRIRKEFQSRLKPPYYAKIKLGPISRGALHRVIIKGFKSMEEAEDFIRENNIAGAFIVGD